MSLAPPISRRPLAPLVALAALWGASWLLVALLSPSWGSVAFELAIGLLLGTMFAQATLAAGWTALGPLPLTWRLPLALIWLAATMLAFTVNMLLHGPGDIENVLAFGGVLVGQWALAQVPLWGVRLWKKLAVCHAADGAAGRPASEQQFGIRQLMILTAIVAVLLGGGRAVLLSLSLEWSDSSRSSDGIAILVFIGLCNVLLTLPLVTAPLLPRRPVLATALGLGFVGLVTAIETPVGIAISPQSGRVEDIIVFCGMNFFHAAWATAALVLLRLAGYRLVSGGGAGVYDLSAAGPKEQA